METPFLSMLTLQSAMNTKVHPQWKDQKFPFYRAAWIECAELAGHLGYKWWKNEIPDIAQVKLEIVDIWHFGLSMLLQMNDPEEVCAKYIKVIDSFQYEVKNSMMDATEKLVLDLLKNRVFSIPTFLELLCSADMTFDDLYRLYVGKNVLNNFRQNNGYKTGTYKKIWAGREDNVHLSEIMYTLETTATEFTKKLYAELQSTYDKLTKV